MPTIKFYLREGLLPPGVPTARNQADYDESHLERLRLIRLLTSVGQLGLAAVRDVLAAVDDKSLSPVELYQAVNGVLYTERVDGRLHKDVGAARQRVNGYLDALGWDVEPSSPAREILAHVLVSFCCSGGGTEYEVLEPYIEAARRLVAHELELLRTGDDVTPAATAVRTVLFDLVTTTVRRLAQEAQIVPVPRP